MRPGLDGYFMGIASLVATRGTCDRAQVGAVLVLNKRILSTGYNGSPSQALHCDEAGHDMQRLETAWGGIGGLHCVRALHSEHNAIEQCRMYGIAPHGATIYCTKMPCPWCAAKIIEAGIVRVVFAEDYRENYDAHTRLLLSSASISTERIFGD